MSPLDSLRLRDGLGGRPQQARPQAGRHRSRPRSAASRPPIPKSIVPTILVDARATGSPAAIPMAVISSARRTTRPRTVAALGAECQPHAEFLPGLGDPSRHQSVHPDDRQHPSQQREQRHEQRVESPRRDSAGDEILQSRDVVNRTRRVYGSKTFAHRRSERGRITGGPHHERHHRGRVLRVWNVHVGIRAVLELGLPDRADDTDDLPRACARWSSESGGRSAARRENIAERTCDPRPPPACRARRHDSRMRVRRAAEYRSLRSIQASPSASRPDRIGRREGGPGRRCGRRSGATPADPRAGAVSPHRRRSPRATIATRRATRATCSTQRSGS